MEQQESEVSKKPIPLRWWYMLIAVLLLGTGIHGFSTGEDPVLAAVLSITAVVMIIGMIRSLKARR